MTKKEDMKRFLDDDIEMKLLNEVFPEIVYRQCPVCEPGNIIDIEATRGLSHLREATVECGQCGRVFLYDGRENSYTALPRAHEANEQP